MQAHQLSDLEWQVIIQNIKAGKCILCLGPGVYSLSEDEPYFTRQLEDYLRAQERVLRIRVQENAWFRLQPGGSDGLPHQAIQNFYNNISEDNLDLLTRLARLRLHLILSLNPDDHLREAFERQGLPHRFAAYERNKPDHETQAPTLELPLIYNLLGVLNKRNSLVLTFDDFYDYLESVFKGAGMSSTLKEQILDAGSFLFIGMPFDLWYVHLFMRILRQHKETGRQTKFAAGRPLSPESLESCAEQYNITFVNSGIQAFVDELFERCEAEGLVKVPATPDEEAKTESYFDELTRLIEENDFERAADRMKEMLSGTGEIGRPFLLKVIQLTGRHRDLKEQMDLGLIKTEAYTLEMNRLRHAFLELIEQLRQDWEKLDIRL